MKEILLSKGDKTIVDDCDYEYLSQWKWYLSNGYAISNDRKKMHRIIMKAKEGEIVDHIDRDKLNNSRTNLRIISREGNVHNQKKRINTFNNYKGTQYVKKLGLWQSRCRINGNDYYLGLYKTEIASAYAYNKKAIELSEYILLNEFDIYIDELEKMLITDSAKKPPAEKKSKQKGLYWHKKSGRMKQGDWEVKVRVDGKYKSLGRFINEQDAIDRIKNYQALLKKNCE
jgi:hypothetical protein